VTRAVDESQLLAKLCRSLQAWGIRARLVTVNEREPVGWGGSTLSEWWWNWYYIQLEDRNIDRVEMKAGYTGQYSTVPFCEIRYCISDERQTAGKQLKAKTKVETEKGEGFLGRVGLRRKVIDFTWVGGGLADLLNRDTELKRVLLGMGETGIEIKPDHDAKCVRISRPEMGLFSPPSKELFEAYDTIAGHVRKAMTLWPERESG